MRMPRVAQAIDLGFEPSRSCRSGMFLEAVPVERPFLGGRFRGEEAPGVREPRGGPGRPAAAPPGAAAGRGEGSPDGRLWPKRAAVQNPETSLRIHAHFIFIHIFHLHCLHPHFTLIHCIFHVMSWFTGKLVLDEGVTMRADTVTRFLL